MLLTAWGVGYKFSDPASADRERRASRLAGDRDRAAVPLDDRLDDREAQPAAAGRPPAARVIDLVEPLEHVRQVLGRDAAPRVDHRQLDAGPARAARRDRSCRRAGVWRSALATRLLERLIEADRIGRQLVGVRRRRARAASARPAPASRSCRCTTEREHPADVEHLRLERRHAVLVARQVEQVHHDALEPPRLAAHGVEIAPPGRRRRARRRASRACRGSRASSSAACAARARCRPASGAAAGRRSAARRCAPSARRPCG